MNWDKKLEHIRPMVGETLRLENGMTVERSKFAGLKGINSIRNVVMLYDRGLISQEQLREALCSKSKRSRK